MSREKEVRESNPIDTPAQPATPARRSRLPLILAVLLLIIIIAAAVVGSLVVFGVISFGGEETPVPTSTPVDSTIPISQFNACAPLLASFPNRYCRQVEIESDSTWSNAAFTTLDLISEEMQFLAIGLPGTQWISPINPALPITKVFWLPEGESIAYARAIVEIANTHPLASITLNGRSLNFSQAAPEDLPSSFAIVDFPTVNNVRQYLVAGRNLIEFQFGNEIAHIPTPEPESTPEVDAPPAPAPLYALLAQVNVPVTGEFNLVATDRFFTDTDWQDAPYVGYLATSNDDTLGDAQWIQGADTPDESGLVTVEKIFYLPEDAPSYFINIDIREGSQLAISLFDNEGNERNIALPPSGGETVQGEGFSFQRFTAIPFGNGFSTGINRLVIRYAPNNTVAHFIRLNLRDSEQETIFVSDNSWLRGAYRAEPEITDGTITLTSPILRGESHLRGYLAIPNMPTERASGNLIVTCLQESGEIGCANISLRHENQVYSFGSDSAPQAITINQPLRLFSLDVRFQSDVFEGFGTIRLGLAYIDSAGTQIAIGQGSSWYAYQATSLVAAPPSVWAIVEDASFITSAGDNQQGTYLNVFETVIPLPTGAVVTNSSFTGSIDDQLLAIYINDELAYSNAAESTDFQQVNNFPIDNALLRAGENRIVVYVINRGSAFGLAMRLDLNYFTLLTE